jgi:hypothetical protein
MRVYVCMCGVTCRYPSLYDRRLKAVEVEFGEREERKGMTSDDLQNIINQHRRCVAVRGLPIHPCLYVSVWETTGRPPPQVARSAGGARGSWGN